MRRLTFDLEISQIDPEISQIDPEISQIDPENLAETVHTISTPANRKTQGISTPAEVLSSSVALTG
jgi:hypothetical protein